MIFERQGLYRRNEQSPTSFLLLDARRLFFFFFFEQGVVDGFQARGKPLI